MQIKERFITEVRHRQAERKHSLSLRQGQRYILRELRVLYDVKEDEEVSSQITLLEQAFRQPVTEAINRELNKIRRNGMAGIPLLHTLRDIYLQHNMSEWQSRRQSDLDIPKIICSEALVE
tara:strand:+ start:436 stop:798 length:363 start_codon:yes stop_codon:yes gene_type:complete